MLFCSPSPPPPSPPPPPPGTVSTTTISGGGGGGGWEVVEEAEEETGSCSSWLLPSSMDGHICGWLLALLSRSSRALRALCLRRQGGREGGREERRKGVMREGGSQSVE